MYLEIDADDDETDGNSDNDVFCLIKQVLFISKQLPTGTIRLTQVI